ncbi:MAG: cytochrome c [Gammaproteobacteria bacterium]|nr:cytochrome c [Gammaproteobacteria bacterium]
MNRRLGVLCLVVIAGLMGFGSAAADEERANSIKNGKLHYMFFCASCHGVKADGKGQTAEYLKISPVNLSTMQQTNSDIPVTDRVLIAVDGRHKVSKGKERKMPVFSENLTFKTVYEITEYLRSIQK